MNDWAIVSLLSAAGLLLAAGWAALLIAVLL